MKYIWVKTKEKYGYKTIFRYFTKGNEDKILLSAGPFYNVFFDDNFVSFGPERTAYPYSRKREIVIPKGIKKIEVLALVHGVPSLDTDFGQPFFGVELYQKDKVVASTTDFKAYQSSIFLTRSFKYSFQRGFGERFDLRDVKETELETYEISPMKMIDGLGDQCDYKIEEFRIHHIYPFKGFDEVRLRNYLNDPKHPENQAFNLKTEFLDVVQNGYQCFQYVLREEKTGLIKIDIDCEEDDTQIFVVFDEFMDGQKWIFSRLSTNDLITINSNRGKKCVISAVPYSLKFLRILVNKKATILPSLITTQNDQVPEMKHTGDQKIDDIIWSARNTFMQNSLDIYTDCPGRERAGWLCDGYFTSMAETFFTGENKIERCFLENFILGEFPTIEKGMLPMAFPAQDTLFIPNWAMWFVLELEQYYRKTKDKSLLNHAKAKVLALAEYFEDFENKYSLLENLHSWVLVDGNEYGMGDYVEGVSFATNMLYCQMLKSITSLYKDAKYAKKAAKIQQNINKLSFNGKLYIDNAIRKNGKLEVVKEHTSETCQYYALYFNITDNKAFADFVKNELGPNRKDQYPDIPKSCSFIGNFLRWLWLKSIGENDFIKAEAIDYFHKRVIYTATVWEKENADSSCNHAFASAIAPLLVLDKLP